MSVRYRSSTIKKETLHTVSLVSDCIQPGDAVLDVGCGEGHVIEELAARGAGEAWGVDILDLRRNRGTPFCTYDGETLPFSDARFDVVVLSFVLHHVPNERKLALLREAVRVSRGTVVVVEDTPVTRVDRLFSRRHGESYRRRIHSTAGYGFLTAGEWIWLCRGMGLEVESKPLSRFCRSLWQPFARTMFVLRRPTATTERSMFDTAQGLRSGAG
jgi:SAM-dependent methyltransferase